MKETAISKIKGFGKAGCIITNIAKAFVIMGMIICIGFGIFCIAFPDDFLKIEFDTKANITIDMEAIGQTLDDMDQDVWASTDFSIDGKEYDAAEVKTEGNKIMVDATAENTTFSLRKAGIIMLAAVVEMAVAFVILIFAGRLCKAIRNCETPFEENVINKIKALGYSLIPTVVLSSIEDSVMGSILSGNLNVYLNVDFLYIIVIAIVFALAYIFSYGAMLQQESDETL